MKAEFIVITPARNEAAYIGETIKSVLSQTVLPSMWVIVDDGSSDDTANIAEEAARAHPWIRVVRRKDRGYRDMHGGLVAVIYEGLRHITATDYEFLFNIDADRVFGPNYFRTILNKFKENPELGIASGVVYENFKGKLIRMKGLPWPTSGGIKCWRRKCFEQIGGLVRGLVWDGIDCFKAMMLGWQTKTFEGQELMVIHLRPEGSSDRSILQGFVRRGRGHHWVASHPLWVLASAGCHMLDYPYVMGGGAMIIGYLQAILQGSEQLGDEELKRFLRKFQIAKLSRILRLR